MTLILSGTNGLSDVDGDASTPAVRGTDANSGIFFGADQVGVATNGVERVEFGNSETVFNDGGASVDFRVEGDTDANLLFVDASADSVGIGTGTFINNAKFQMSAGSGASAAPYAAILNTASSPTSSASTRLSLGFLSGTSNFVATNTVLGEFDFMGQANDSSYGGASITAQVTSGGNVGRTAGHSVDLLFSTKPSNGAGATERMRIDSSGNLLVGATSATAGTGSTVWNSNNSTWAFRVNSAAPTNPNGILITYSAAAPNGTGDQFLYCEDSGSTQRMSVRSNGGIANYSGNDANLSDRREKTNFAPAKNYLDTICAIPVQTFNYIDQNQEDDPGLTLGVVAQDVQQVAPELVMESNWAGRDQEPKMRLSIYQTDLQYALMKSIQELKAELDEAKARIAALETGV